MTTVALLDPERTAIFNAQVPEIEKEVRIKYGHLPFADELKQTLLLEYAMALAGADLSRNYKSFCWQKMIWSGVNYLKLHYTKEQHLLDAVDFDDINEPEQLTSRDDDCNAKLNLGLLIEQMGQVFEKLNTSEQLVISAEFDKGGGSDTLAHFSYDKRKRIARHFKQAVLTQIMDN